jgi:hypothetical protein
LAGGIRPECATSTAWFRLKWLKAGNNLHECPNLVAIAQRLDVLVTLFADLSHVLIVSTAIHLREDAHTQKSRNGWISYSGHADPGGRFSDRGGCRRWNPKIRNRYRVAFVMNFRTPTIAVAHIQPPFSP